MTDASVNLRLWMRKALTGDSSEPGDTSLPGGFAPDDSPTQIRLRLYIRGET